jgi:hypothetical protein
MTTIATSKIRATSSQLGSANPDSAEAGEGLGDGAAPSGAAAKTLAGPADITAIRTPSTNAPLHLPAALAGRPGRGSKL